jgi:2-oxoglutarate ferredoxin oxidoreductase subunit gamma
MGSLEIRIAGFGGQGVILAGMVIGRAATIYDTKHVTLTQSFGPEARGSACSVQLIVSPEPVLNPYLTHPHLLVAMSQEAYTRFAPDLRPGGLLLYEEDLIELEPLRSDISARGIPATRFAEELGRKLVLNMVMVGFVTGQTGIITPEAARESVADSVPKGTEALNTSAFEKGLEYGLSLKKNPQPVAGKVLDISRFFEDTEGFVRS